MVWETSHTIQRELEILNERIPLVAQQVSVGFDRLRSILQGCQRLARTIGQEEVRPIHRDFYQDQVILNGSQVYLLDFDLACMGNPALDIGNFLGHVAEQSLRETGDSQSLAEVEQVLMDRYCALAGEHYRTAIQVYRTMTLVRHIYISSIMPERQQTTLPLIELCETLLNGQGA
ncbi:MAG: phosphotransferase [Pirellulaceae bacterium]